MPYLEELTQPDWTQDSVFKQQPSDSVIQDTLMPSSPESPAPRRSARSTKGAPPVHFGKVYTYSTIISNVDESPKFRQTLLALYLLINYTILLCYRCIYY